jgi:hypothetical protein
LTAEFELGILPEPLQPPISGRCDKCGRWLALKLVKKRAVEDLGSDIDLPLQVLRPRTSPRETAPAWSVVTRRHASLRAGQFVSRSRTSAGVE